MPSFGPKVTERSFYDALMDMLREAGGTAVSEVKYNSEPDITFELGGHRWFLPVKIGTDSKTFKDAFLQYLRHKEESDIKFGVLLFLPVQIRKVPPTESEIKLALQNTIVTALIDADLVKEELRDRTFGGVILFLLSEVLFRLKRKQATYYSMPLVISLLKQQVAEMMEEIRLTEKDLFHIITDRQLLKDIGHLEPRKAEAVAHFLASYIFLSQILFLRLLITANPTFFSLSSSSVSRTLLRQAFKRILDINYRPIYEIDILDAISDKFLQDTFALIWGLEIERIRYELPGRIFHELMPFEIRKMLAAFYTRPLAAEALAHLTVSQSTQTVFDPACGSGTILTEAYKRKLKLWDEEGKTGNPHVRFCEQDIYGADIMPFAVHLTSANLAAMDPSTFIELTQVIQRDSLSLTFTTYPAGIQIDLYPTRAITSTTRGEKKEISLNSVDVILMNPPFTKVERGIANFVDMKRFSSRCGGEVGLWGHFIALADGFLKDKGTFGAVLPVNVLRGRESQKVRQILFENWAPLYILKPTRNYGFSEWAEYRDVLFIALKQKPKPDHRVKFCLIKKDLTRLTEGDVSTIADEIKTKTKIHNSDLVDIDSHPLSEIKNHFRNTMWFCGVTNLSHRDAIIKFLNRFSRKLCGFPAKYFHEGYRPVPKGVSKFLFLTRHSCDSRIEKAFLRFSQESTHSITATSPLGAHYEIEKKCLTPTLRTSVGIPTMDITHSLDHIAHAPYAELQRVCSASGQKKPPGAFWSRVQTELQAITTNIVVSNRINPFSPDTNLTAFFSVIPVSPSNQLNVIVERKIPQAQAVCVLLNSILFFAKFFLLKEESTGRYIHIRFYDLEEMELYPPEEIVKSLAKIFQQYHKVKFPSLREQFDQNFDQRYEEFWEKERGFGQQRLLSTLGKLVKPFPARLEFDFAVCEALGVPVSKADLFRLYEIIVHEMILIKGLARD